jgi:LPXTG-site transpeptidase (sortase) family protein
VTPPRDPLIRRHRLRGARARTVLAALVGVLTGVAILAATVAAAGTVGFDPRGAAAASGTWLAPPPAPPRTPAAGQAWPKAPSGPPTWLRIPSIGVSASLQPLTTNPAGQLNPPSNFDDAGWYTGGTAPGDIGPAIIAGHYDSRCCAAVFYKLSQLKAGDIVEVDRGGQTLRFTVLRKDRYPKADFPTSEVYKPTPDPELRLITCGGVFDKSARSYVDNVVVYAAATP